MESSFASRYANASEGKFQFRLRQDRIKPRLSEGITLAFGNARLNVERLYANLGIVWPNATVETEFHLTNVGDHEIVIVGKPQSSCGCTVADLAGTSALQPGKTLPLKVRVMTAKRDVRHTITIVLQDSNSEERLPLKLEVLGSQVGSLAIVPSHLDFGVVARGTSVNRTLRLSEVSSDRFKITSVDVDSLPLTYTLLERCNGSGLNDYYVNFALAPSKRIGSGEQRSAIIVKTDSRLQPSIEVPIRFSIQPEIEVYPRILTFGTITTMIAVEGTVTLVSPWISADCAVEFSDLPPGITAHVVSSEREACRICIGLTANKSGPVRESFKLRVVSGQCSEEITLECSAYAQLLRGEDSR